MPRRRGAGRAAWLAVGAILGSVPAAASDFVPYSHYQALSLDQIARLQVELTYLGGRRGVMPSLGFTAAGHAPAAGLMESFRRPGFAYAEGDSDRIACSLSVEELRAVIDSVGTLPDVTDGNVDSVGVYSFALLDTSGSAPQAFEAIVNENSGLELMVRMRDALRGNPRVAGALALIACGLRAPTAAPPGEVTPAVAVTFGGFSNDPATRRVRCRVRVLNRSRSPIPGPLVLVLGTSTEAVGLADADGYTCRVSAPGSPYVILPVEGTLAPGKWMERPLEFDNPRQVSFQITPRVFTGLAER